MALAKVGREMWHLPQSPLPMWIFDHGSGAILEANDAALREYGYTRRELLARRVRDLCVGRGPGGSLLDEPQVGPLGWVGHSLQRRKDGSTFEAEVAMTETPWGSRDATMVIVDPEVQRPPLVRAVGT